MTSMWIVVAVALALIAPAQLRSLNEQDLKRAIDVLRSLTEAGNEERGPDQDFSDLLGNQRREQGDGQKRTAPDFKNLLQKKSDTRSEQMTDVDRRDDFSSLASATRSKNSGRSTSRNQSLMQRLLQNRQGTSLSLSLCYFCDDKCIDDITSAGYADSDAYFEALSDDLSLRFNTISGYTFTVSDWINLYPNMEIEGTWYTAGTTATGQDLLAHVNNLFWSTGDLMESALSYGCDMGLLVISSRDVLWNMVGGIVGIANMLQACQSYSTSTLQLNTNEARMATLLAHEMGHLLGMYHDGPMNDAYVTSEASFTSNPDLSPLYYAIEDSCSSTNNGCPDGNCIMNPVVNTQTSFSSCSTAYFEMYRALVDEYPTYYSDLCLTSRGLEARDDGPPISMDPDKE